jgi:hypothetical protein
LHQIFAQVPFKLDDLMKEHERLAVSETRILRNLASGDEYEAWVAKTSRASGVESLFTGMEGVLKLVLQSVGEKVYHMSTEGQHTYHAQLIAQAATATPTRPAIISSSLYGKLDDLRKFRHLERNVYGDVLDDGKVEDKVATVLGVVPMFRTEIEAFMTAMSTPKPESSSELKT